MLQEVIFAYCKSKKISVSKTKNTYFLKKKDKRVATIAYNINDKMIEMIEGDNDKTSYSTVADFIADFRSKIKIDRMLRTFKGTSKPRPWRHSQHRNKMTELGREHIMEYTDRQNRRYIGGK